MGHWKLYPHLVSWVVRFDRRFSLRVLFRLVSYVARTSYFAARQPMTESSAMTATKMPAITPSNRVLSGSADKEMNAALMSTERDRVIADFDRIARLPEDPRGNNQLFHRYLLRHVPQNCAA